jgi:protein-L-isoaspartate(D-aspartate) O-methyltransferase
VLDRTNGLVALVVPDDRDVDIDGLRRALEMPAVVRASGVSLRRDRYGDLALWLAITEPRSCNLSADGTTPAPLEPAMLWAGTFRSTPGVLGASGIALLARRPATDELSNVDIHGYGPEAERLATDLAGQVRAWDTAGRPSSAGLRITAYPLSEPVPAGIVITKAHTRMAIVVEP